MELLLLLPRFSGGQSVSLQGKAPSLRTKCAGTFDLWKSSPSLKLPDWKGKLQGWRGSGRKHTVSSGPSPMLHRDWEAHKINRAALLTLQYHKRGLERAPLGCGGEGRRGMGASLKLNWGWEEKAELNRGAQCWKAPTKMKILPLLQELSQWKKAQGGQAQSGQQRVVVGIGFQHASKGQVRLGIT